MPYLQSAALEAIVYNESTHVLRARFRDSGKTMIYEDVPQDVYDQLIFADSIGRFFHDRIAGAYPAREVPDCARKPM